MIDYLTTGQVAQILGTSDRYIAQLCDQGVLPSHTLPGSNRRRIGRDDLAELMRKCGIPVTRIRQHLCGKIPNGSVLVSISDRIVAESIASGLDETDEFVADCCSSALATGLILGHGSRSYVIYDIDMIAPAELYDLTVTLMDDIPILVAYGDATTATMQGIVRCGYAQCYLKADEDVGSMIERMKELHHNEYQERH